MSNQFRCQGRGSSKEHARTRGRGEVREDRNGKPGKGRRGQNVHLHPYPVPSLEPMRPPYHPYPRGPLQ
eukprot:12004323-Heterocapsa_arctica.AAC.1